MTAAQTRSAGRESRDEINRKVNKSRRKVILAGISLTLAVLGVGAALWFTPLLSVRHTDVSGNSAVATEDILSALDVPTGLPLLRVDTGAAASRVAGISKIASARVQRMYPSGIRVTVTERVPVVFFTAPDGTHLMDDKAVDFAVQPPPPGTVQLVTDTPADDNTRTAPALSVLAAMNPALRSQIGIVTVKSVSSIAFTLLDGRILTWGSSSDNDRKSAVALVLLAQPGKVYDVSSPDLPTTK